MGPQRALEEPPGATLSGPKSWVMGLRQRRVFVGDGPGRASRARRSQEGPRRARKSHEEKGGTRKRQREPRNTLIY